ncbi:SRPBCC family protein [Amphibiibacter pelophylacis]|uniref:SRPBCC family protein n=1 Tax=Amphibiibacter pelophylacis TaxID=1799477 RepID=A0ACC6NZA7_9BURK
MSSDTSPRTVTLHRVLRAPPRRVYSAFVDAHALARWLPPYGFLAEIDQFDPVVGGRFHMAFRNFGTGSRHGFGGEFLELEPGRRLRYTDRFDPPGPSGLLEVTIDLQEVVCGTELRASQSGIPAGIPLEMCLLGWQESLAQLARLVEPEIPG